MTVKCVDTYCELYRDLFVEVRAYESFKYLQLGIINDIKRKSLPEIAKLVGLKNEQGLLHFLTESPWKGDKYKTKPEIAIEIVKELKERGFKIKRVLADSL